MKVMIGLETHVQLKTRTKLFCGCATQAPKEPNTPPNVCPICMGFPGSKPALNARAVEFGAQIAFAFNCAVAPEMWFSRKSYFYPDLPKGFQITQYEVPLASGGTVEFEKGKTVRIRRVHLEEDPAKLEHEGDIVKAEQVLIDYTRSGIPLCEIVTEPDFSTPAEARVYLERLFTLLSYLEVIDPKAEGVMRSDGNVSIDGGERVEIKNITGIAAVEQALKSEINRQISLANLGKKVVRETRLFDDASGRTLAMRTKEEEEDYGYIFEPDLPIVPMKALSEGVRASMREMPDEALLRIKGYGVPDELARAIVFTPGLVRYYDECAKTYADRLNLARWLSNDFLKCLNWNSLEVSGAPPPSLISEMLSMVDAGELTERAAKDVIKEVVAKKIGAREILGQAAAGAGGTDEEIVASVVAENAKAAADFKSGNQRAIQFLIGEVMKKTRARIPPQKARELLLKALSG
jgi:aspartyl-tRNA(Asn)/glutamyl-tRNA(Gln) amidotransferase subunit B